MRQVMLIDTVRCVGCHACAIACKSENNVPANVFWNKVLTGTPDKPDLKMTKDTPRGKLVSKGGVVNDRTKGMVAVEYVYYTKACQHCDNPPCLQVCPTKAIFKHPNGVVDTKYEDCIGCDSCIDVCPYDVRHHNTSNEKYYLDFATGGQGISAHKPETVDKCMFCQHLLEQGKLPACVENCSSAARFSGDLDDQNSEVSKMLKSRKYLQLRPELGTKPSIYFLI